MPDQNWFQTPLLPQSAIQGLQDSLTQPKLDQSPTMARVKGFGAGALEGLRNLTSPESLATIGSMLMGGRGGGELPEPSFKPSLDIPARQYSGPVQETLGESNPDFTPVGGEGLYNVGKKSPNAFNPTDPATLGYSNLLARGGR